MYVRAEACVRTTTARQQQQQAPAQPQDDNSSTKPKRMPQKTRRTDLTKQNVTSATLTAPLLGESEKIVKALFHLAKALSPSIVFFDEIDALCSHRGGHTVHEASRRIKSELLMNMDATRFERDRPDRSEFPAGFGPSTAPTIGQAHLRRPPRCAGASVYLPHKLSFSIGKIRDTHMPIQKRHRPSRRRHYTGPVDFKGITTHHDSNVIVLTAANFPRDLDQALLRRLNRRIYVALPDAAACEAMLRHNMRGNFVENDDWPDIARRLQNYSGADMAALCAAEASGQFWEEVTAGTDLTNLQVLAAVSDSVIGRPSRWRISSERLEG
uniref:ATPase AAA-type core domain-containing protein n=1 Tax=Globodera rostochiensis TaxID=31243 RepID=A0A914H7N2_GLORO